MSSLPILLIREYEVADDHLLASAMVVNHDDVERVRNGGWSGWIDGIDQAIIHCDWFSTHCIVTRKEPREEWYKVLQAIHRVERRGKFVLPLSLIGERLPFFVVPFPRPVIQRQIQVKLEFENFADLPAYEQDHFKSNSGATRKMINGCHFVPSYVTGSYRNLDIARNVTPTVGQYFPVHVGNDRTACAVMHLTSRIAQNCFTAHLYTFTEVELSPGKQLRQSFEWHEHWRAPDREHTADAVVAVVLAEINNLDGI